MELLQTVTLHISPELYHRLYTLAVASNTDIPGVIARLLPSHEHTPASDAEQSRADAAWDELLQAAAENRLATDTGDLAYQHDHYLYGTPKKSPPQ